MHVERQDISAQVHQADVKGRSGSIVRTARSTGREPNLIQYESGTHLMSIADGDNADLMGIENSLLGQVLKIMFFKWHGDTQVQFTEQPEGT